MSSAVFYRDLRASYASVVSAEGMYLRTDSGRRILDAVGGAGTVVLGHAVREITDAIAQHGGEISFSYGATFTNPWQEQLAEALVAMNPRIASRVYFGRLGSGWDRQIQPRLASRPGLGCDHERGSIMGGDRELHREARSLP